MQYEEIRVHSTASKCVNLRLNHELEVSNPLINITNNYCNFYPNDSLSLSLHCEDRYSDTKPNAYLT